ncbi:MAG TPA: PASTA domain-containing protein, partial [Burkholderiaceae bacterium]|nr:PASTA domain-containing protein [Burkholderiaceae bacterium]
PEGQVIEQSPRAASRVAAGSVIVLTVSSAPRGTVEIFEMPNVVGRAYTDAARSLAEFKVSRTEIASAEAPGRIVAQTPAAGATLLPGDAVSLQISAGAAASAAPAVQSSTASNGPANASATAKPETPRGVFRGVIAIGAAIVLGLIFGALLMRHWVLRQRAVAAADEAIVGMSPTPPTFTSVDILLEEDAEAHARADDLRMETPVAEPQSSESTVSEPREDSESSSEQEKRTGS